MNFVCTSVFLAVLLSVAATERVSYRNYTVYKVTPKNDEALQALKELDGHALEYSTIQFWEGPTKVGRETQLLVGPDSQRIIKQMFSDLAVETSVMVQDVQALIDGENIRARAGVSNAVNWLVYNTLEEINAWLEGLAVEFPNAITVLKPGKTHLGRDIVGVKLDFSPSTSKQVVFMESNIHAREWITSATTTYILDQFLRSNDTSVRQLAEKYTWYFFPVMNPDGFAFSHESNRLWRKTRTRYSIFCYGADPNRNWGYQWMTGGASANPCSDTYGGPAPFSEPCVDVMRRFISNITDNMVAYLDFHSFSQMLLLPFGHTTQPLANYNEMMEIAEAAMTRLRAVHNVEYVWGNIAETIYVATGSSMDWVKGVYNVPIAYTYELRDRGQFGFLLPAEQIIPTAEETLESVLAIFEEYERRHPSHQ